MTSATEPSADQPVDLPPSPSAFARECCAFAVSSLAAGEAAITYKSPLSARKDAYDYSCCLARLDEYWHVMTDPSRGLVEPGLKELHDLVRLRAALLPHRTKRLVSAAVYIDKIYV